MRVPVIFDSIGGFHWGLCWIRDYHFLHTLRQLAGKCARAAADDHSERLGRKHRMAMNSPDENPRAAFPKALKGSQGFDQIIRGGVPVVERGSLSEEK